MSTSFAVETLAHSDLRQGLSTAQNPKTCGHTTLKSCEGCDLFGCSESMCRPPTQTNVRQCSLTQDTRSSSSKWTAPRLRARVASVSTYAECLLPRGSAQSRCFLSENAIRGILNRVVKRKKSLRVLLRSRSGTTPVTITFLTKDSGCVSWTASSENDSRDFTTDGLIAFLRPNEADSWETP